MNTVSINIPEAAFAVLRKNQDDLRRELLTAAVVKWFELGTKNLISSVSEALKKVEPKVCGFQMR